MPADAQGAEPVLPRAQVRITDNLFRVEDGERTCLKIAEVLVDGTPVAQLPVTGARYEMSIEGLSKLHIELLADDAVMHSLGEVPR